MAQNIHIEKEINSKMIKYNFNIGQGKNMKKYIKYFFIAIFTSIIITHYFEGIQTKFLIASKSIILGSSLIYDSENVIPRTKYSHLGQPVINPVHVALSVKKDSDKVIAFRKANIDCHKLMNAQTLDKIIQMADFFIEYGYAMKFKNINYILYPYKFDFFSYDDSLIAPWYSGMAQGLAIETLLAAYIITNDEKYMDIARLSANAFSVPVENDGVAVFLPECTGVWFEEYADRGVTPPFVLNGHNFALIGLGKLAYFDSSYQDIYKAGIRALLFKLPHFDNIVWSRYDLIKYMANPKYQQIHIDQLKELGQSNSNELMLKYSNKFTMQKYIPLGVFYRIIFYPHRSLIFVFSMNFLFVFLIICFFKRRG